MMITTTPGLPWAYASAPSTEASASVEPTERSIPRVRMTSSWPMASTAMAAVWASTLLALPVVKNTGDSSVIATTRPTSIRTGPSRMTAEGDPQEPELAALAIVGRQAGIVGESGRCCVGGHGVGRGQLICRLRLCRRHSPSWSSCRPPRYGSPALAGMATSRGRVGQQTSMSRSSFEFLRGGGRPWQHR